MWVWMENWLAVRMGWNEIGVELGSFEGGVGVGVAVEKKSWDSKLELGWQPACFLLGRSGVSWRRAFWG